MDSNCVHFLFQNAWSRFRGEVCNCSFAGQGWQGGDTGGRAGEEGYTIKMCFSLSLLLCLLCGDRGRCVPGVAWLRAGGGEDPKLFAQEWA